MTWLKIDDGFTQHPKLAGWTPAQKWSWLEVLVYCARYDTGGRIPDDLDLMPRSVKESLLTRAENAGLLDRTDDGGRVVHDWPIYNGKTVHEKVAYYLAKHPEAGANEVYKALGGKRELILAEYAKLQSSGSLSGSQSGSREPPNSGTREPENPVPKSVPSPSRPDPTPHGSDVSLEELPPSSNESLDEDDPDNGVPAFQPTSLAAVAAEEGGR